MKQQVFGLTRDNRIPLSTFIIFRPLIATELQQFFEEKTVQAGGLDVAKGPGHIAENPFSKSNEMK